MRYIRINSLKFEQKKNCSYKSRKYHRKNNDFFNWVINTNFFTRQYEFLGTKNEIFRKNRCLILSFESNKMLKWSCCALWKSTLSNAFIYRLPLLFILSFCLISSDICVSESSTASILSYKRRSSSSAHTYTHQILRENFNTFVVIISSVLSVPLNRSTFTPYSSSTFLFISARR